MKQLFTSESVSEGHPDKMADQISDALLDNYLAFDKTSKVACETLVNAGSGTSKGLIVPCSASAFKWGVCSPISLGDKAATLRMNWGLIMILHA